MGDVTKDEEKGDQDLEMPRLTDSPFLPRSLTLAEKKYLLAVERGNLANVRRMLHRSYRQPADLHVNCVDSLGRGALSLAIDAEHMEMVELLVVMGVETRDALLHAINAEFVEAVELLLEHEELIHKEGEPYSWQKVDPNTATFTSDITPLVLAAHRNNYEIIKILLDRGATLPMPHDIRCGCVECVHDSMEDSLRHSQSRVNEYRALASPSLMALSSSDPILTAFELSWELRNLAFAEQEFKNEYLDLRKQCQVFAVDLLGQSRSSHELAIILNYAPDTPPYEQGDHMKLARLELAINFKQKKFVAHPHIQQLLAAIWYEGVPGFRRKTALEKLFICLRVAILFPFYCSVYILAPNSSTGKLMRKPFMKFLIHASSYLFFLLILILVSQRAEVQIIQLFGTESMKKSLEKELLKQRGNGPTSLELLVVVYVLGFIWEESQEMYIEGIRSYLRNMWNFIDFTQNLLYTSVMILRCAAYMQQRNEIAKDPDTKFIARENWDAFDPQLIAEGLFAAANIFSALKLVHLFSINPHLGPLQISLGRMVIDIVKFFFIYSLVLFAFACGLNQLLWYFAELEKKKCYVLPGGLPDWDHAADSCRKWRSFGNVFEASQSLFWASFGMVGLENFELAGIKSYTRFWGLLMFGSYSMINVIVLLNLLIAMMSNSYAMITEHSDVEWKFARTRLWMSYFEESATLPPPFNIFPTPKLFFKLVGIRNKDKLRRIQSTTRKEMERDVYYMSVMRALVWRYVSAVHRKADDEPVTEEDVNEIKGDISSMRYELLEVLERNGMDVSFADRKEKAVLGKRMKIWERRLMKDFHVAPSSMQEDTTAQGVDTVESENSLARFRRVARLAVANTSSAKWGQVIRGICASSQIGRSRSRDSFKNQQKLKQAIDEAKKTSLRSPKAESSTLTNAVLLQTGPEHSLLDLLKNMADDTEAVLPAGNTRSLATAGGRMPASPSIRDASSQLSSPKCSSPITGQMDSRSLTSKPEPHPTSPRHPVAPGHTADFATNDAEITPKNNLSPPTGQGILEGWDNPTEVPLGPGAGLDIALARPMTASVASPKAPEGDLYLHMLPPPPAKKREISVVPSVEVTPVTSEGLKHVSLTTPLASRPPSPTVSPPTSAGWSSSVVGPPSVQSRSPSRSTGRSSPVPLKLPGSTSPSPAPDINTQAKVKSSRLAQLSSTSSTDCLLPASPERLNVATVKHQTRSRWL